MSLMAKFGTAWTLFYLGILTHEKVTGCGYIRDVAMKLMHQGVSKANAVGFAVAIVLIAPLVVCGGLLLFVKKEPQKELS